MIKADTIIEKEVAEVPELMGYPMKRLSHGFAWQHSSKHYSALLVPVPIHYWEGRNILPIDTAPKQGHDGSMIFPHTSGMGILPDNTFWGNEIKYKLRSAGVMVGDKYTPIWYPGLSMIEDNLFTQQVGPFIHQVRFHRFTYNDEFWLYEMPDLVGDKFAIQYDAVGLAPPDQCPCRPYLIDGTGEYYPVEKKRWGGGKFKLVDLDLLETLAFPVMIDPEIGIAGSHDCWAQGINSNFTTARATSNNYAYHTQFRDVGIRIPVGQTDYRVARWSLAFDATSLSGTLENAKIKADCYTNYFSDHDKINDYFLFKRYDGSAHDPCTTQAIAENIYDGVRDAAGVTRISSIEQHMNIGCGSSTDDYTPWKNLSGADVTHLDTYDGLGNDLWWGIMTLDDENAVGGLSAGEAKMLTLDVDFLLLVNAFGQFAWIIGG